MCAFVYVETFRVNGTRALAEHGDTGEIRIKYGVMLLSLLLLLIDSFHSIHAH